jgi:ribosomal protein L11 methyltransferase
MRRYPALDIRWIVRPDDDHIERLLAEIDQEAPTAVEDRPSGVRVFFPSSAARGRAVVHLIAVDPSIECRPVEVSDGRWAERSQASLGPVHLGRLVIAPPWTPPDDLARLAALVITIQPSMGFGTGHHASTRLCLRLLQQVSVTGASVLDVGTGSGVLALGAWRLGAARVVAVDRDPDALHAAHDSVARNGASAAVTVRALDLADGAGTVANGPFDLLLANLTAGSLVRDAATLDQWVNRPGHAIVGGILVAEEAAVVTAFEARGWSVRAREREDEWVGVLFATTPTPSTAP